MLREAINVTNLFVPKNQLIVTTKSKVKKYNKTYLTKNEPIDVEIPLAIIINDRSASASEIVSGSLQDLDRAVIIEIEVMVKDWYKDQKIVMVPK